MGEGLGLFFFFASRLPPIRGRYIDLRCWNLTYEFGREHITSNEFVTCRQYVCGAIADTAILKRN